MKLDYHSLLKKAKRLKKQEKYEEALNILRELYKKGYRNRELLTEIIWILFLKGEYVKSYEMLNIYLSIYSPNRFILWILFSIEKKGIVKLTKKEINSILEKTFDVEALKLLSREIKSKKYYSLQKKIYERLEKKLSKDKEILYKKLFFTIKTKSYEELKEGKDFASKILYSLFKLKDNREKLNQEIDNILSIEKFQEDENLLFLIGTLLRETKHYDIALKIFSFLKKKTKKDIYNRHIAFLLAKQKDFEPSFSLLKDLLKENPEDFYTWKALFKLSKDTNNLERLQEFLLELNELYPDEKKIWGYIRKTKKALET